MAATVGSSMFTDGGSRVTSSVRDGVTWPFTYEGIPLMEPDKKFSWPLAPLQAGRALDLRALFVHDGCGFVAAAHQIPGRTHGFVAVAQPAIGLAMGYLFSSAVFPWVTLWEENRSRQDWPWCGQVQARGIEFGTTPLPLGNAAVDAHGPLLGYPTSLELGPRQTQRAPWMLFLAAIPHDWREVQDIRVEAEEIVLTYRKEEVRLLASGAAAFLKATRDHGRAEEALCEH